MKDKRTYQDRKEYLQKYQREYYHNNPEQRIRCLDRNKTEEAKEYNKQWKRDNPDKIKKADIKFGKSNKRKEYLNEYRKNPKHKEYIKNWNLNNPDKIKARYKKYEKTDKGKLNSINKTQNRRAKFKQISGKFYDKPNVNLIKLVDNRDKICVYCNHEFKLNILKGKYYPTYDHLNAFIPHSEINTVKCCNSCNGSKTDKDVLIWLKEKNYPINSIVLELLKIQKNKYAN